MERKSRRGWKRDWSAKVATIDEYEKISMLEEDSASR